MVFGIETRSKYLSGIKLARNSKCEEKGRTDDSFFNLIVDNEHCLKLTDMEKEDQPLTDVKLASAIDPGIDFSESTSSLPKKSLLLKDDQITTCDEPEAMKKSVLKPGFEKQYTIPPYVEGVRALKRERKKQREKTKGADWYDLPSTELTEELKNDLVALQMRKSWDPKQFYKKNDTNVLPKYFQVGTIVETSADYYHARIPKKQRKKTIVEELLADAEFRKYNKKKYQQIISNQPLKKRIISKKQRKRQM